MPSKVFAARWLGLLLVGMPVGAAALNDAAQREQLRNAEAAQAAEQSAHDRAMTRSQAAQADALFLTSQRTQLAARLRGAEVETEAALQRMDALAYKREAARQRLAARAADLQTLLPLIERLTLYPAETLLAVPASPESALQGLLVLQGLTRRLEQEAEALGQQQRDVEQLTKDVNAQARQLAAAQTAQLAQAALLDRQIEASRQTARSADDAGMQAARRAAAAGAQADSLRGAIAQIAAQSRSAAPPRQPGFGAPIGQLAAPVAGSVIRGFGDATEAGPASGLSYAGPPNARVVSPCAGRVVFAAPFRSYGRLLIVDCGGGYHFVLAGLDRLDAPVGQLVQAGEPVGVMGAWDPHAPSTRPALYVELRHDGVAVNPAPWLRAKG